MIEAGAWHLFPLSEFESWVQGIDAPWEIQNTAAIKLR